VSGFTRVVQLYVVRVEAHRVEPRFDVPERTYELYARSRRWAVHDAVMRVCREAGVCTLWRPWLREVARHTRIVRVEERTVRA
jgi:hypothetical protein